jgi:hypothetical protein
VHSSKPAYMYHSQNLHTSLPTYLVPFSKPTYLPAYLPTLSHPSRAICLVPSSKPTYLIIASSKTIDLPCTIIKSYLPYTILKTYLPCNSILKTYLSTYLPWSILKHYLPTYLEASSNTTYLPTLKHPQTLPTYLPWSILGSYIPTYLFRPQQILFCGDDCFARFCTSRAVEVFPSPTSSLPIDRPTHQSRLSLGTSIFLEHQS